MNWPSASALSMKVLAMIHRCLLAAVMGATLIQAAVFGDEGFVSVSGSKFLDPQGRHLLLHGVNIVDKSANWEQYKWLDEAGYAAMKSWGFNCIRLGFTWAAVEPEPGKYNPACLAELDRRVAWAAKHGMYVVLDMHQDLFSMKFSDGAPEWATLTDGKPHVAAGEVWSDAYFTSPAVQTAFDNFYANKPGPGGIGLQDRYAAAWKFLAEHFANNRTVIGYDLMNEPFAGSLVTKGMLQLVKQVAAEFKNIKDSAVQGELEVMALWGTPDGRSKILKIMEDPEVYGRVLDTAQPVFEEFERTTLTQLFQKVTDAIRQVDQSHIIFLETSGASNMGVRSTIEPMKLADGRRDARQAYAPHGYDLVTDTSDVAAASNARVELIFARHGQTQQRLEMPMLVGEWGAYYGGNAAATPAAQFVCRQFERLLCSDTYWSLEEGFAQQPVLQALCRPYPMAIAGTVLAYEANPDSQRFTCTWNEDGAAKSSNQFFVPASFAPSKERIRLEPAGKGIKIEPVAEGSENVYVTIPPTGASCQRRLVIESSSSGPSLR